MREKEEGGPGIGAEEMLVRDISWRGMRTLVFEDLEKWSNKGSQRESLESTDVLEETTILGGLLGERGGEEGRGRKDMHRTTCTPRLRWIIEMTEKVHTK